MFFKLRRSSQTTLEGTHDLNVQFIVPADWQSGRIEVSCAAHGTHKLFGLVEQPKLSGQLRRTVELHLAGNTEARQAAERRARRDKTTVRRPIACECDCPAGQGV